MSCPSCGVDFSQSLDEGKVTDIWRDQKRWNVHTLKVPSWLLLLIVGSCLALFCMVLLS